MKPLRKWLLLLAALALCLALLPGTAWAVDENVPEYTVGSVTYYYTVVENDGQKAATITGLKSVETSELTLEIPGIIPTDDSSNISVTAIKESAFQKNEYIKSVTIPEGVTTIGQQAFSGCTSLQSVIIPNSVTTIGPAAFYDTALTEVTVPESIRTWDGAFTDCDQLKRVTILAGVSNIGLSTFSNCTSLESVTIPDTVTTIGVSAFNGCTSLKAVTIPNSVTTIGMGAFRNCGLISVAIPDGITIIDDNTFNSCTSLESVTIPDSTTTIGRRAFYNCTSLTSVNIPASVTTILGGTVQDTSGSLAVGAFQNCANLTSVTFAEGSRIRNIADNAFTGCSNNLALWHYGNQTVIDYALTNGLTAKLVEEMPTPGGVISSYSVPTYTITLPAGTTGGQVKASRRFAARGVTVTLTVTPDAGYKLAELTVTDRSGTEIQLTDKGGGKYTFAMPGRAVTVKAVFVGIMPWNNPFTDVQDRAGYAGAVGSVCSHGLMAASATTIEPDAAYLVNPGDVGFAWYSEVACAGVVEAVGAWNSMSH